MPSISVDISTGADDGFFSYNTRGKANRSYSGNTLFVGHYTAGSSDIMALRFQTINIPQGATINSATLSIKKNRILNIPGVVKIYGNNVDNAPAWGIANIVKNISKTAHSTLFDTISATSTNDVTAIVQDIVNRGGWAANHAMAFGLFAITTVPAYWAGYAYESGNKPNLSVTYTSGPPPTSSYIFVGGFF